MFRNYVLQLCGQIWMKGLVEVPDKEIMVAFLKGCTKTRIFSKSWRTFKNQCCYQLITVDKKTTDVVCTINIITEKESTPGTLFSRGTPNTMFWREYWLLYCPYYFYLTVTGHELLPLLNGVCNSTNIFLTLENLNHGRNSFATVYASNTIGLPDVFETTRITLSQRVLEALSATPTLCLLHEQSLFINVYL